MSKLNKILDDIIKSKYPELLGEDIRIEFVDLDDSLMEYGSLTNEGFFIDVDKKLKEADDIIIIGGIAHELSHIAIELSIGKKMSFKDLIAYKISKRYKTLDERNTDLDVILRGLGKELYQFMKFSSKIGYDYYKEDGLSLREIELLLIRRA